MQQPKCIVCLRDNNLESHHIHQVSLGGPLDGPQVWLCALCHRNIHTAANRVYSGKHTFMELFTSEEFENAKVLIQAIVSDKIRLESSGRPADAVRRLMITIPSKLYVDLTRKKLDGGFSSMESYLIAVLTQAAK